MVLRVFYPPPQYKVLFENGFQKIYKKDIRWVDGLDGSVGLNVEEFSNIIIENCL